MRKEGSLIFNIRVQFEYEIFIKLGQKVKKFSLEFFIKSLQTIIVIAEAVNGKISHCKMQEEEMKFNNELFSTHRHVIKNEQESEK